MTQPAPPAELAWLSDVVGVDAMLVLMERYAGVRVYVPGQVDEDCVLAKAIGVEAARRLAEARPREMIKVPAAKQWRTCVYRERGMTYAAIARTLGIDNATVHRHLKPQAPRFDQMDMFAKAK